MPGGGCGSVLRLGGFPPVLLRAVARAGAAVFFFLGGGVGESESDAGALRLVEGPALLWTACAMAVGIYLGCVE